MLTEQMGEPGKRPDPSTVSKQLRAPEKKGQAKRERRGKHGDLWYGV